VNPDFYPIAPGDVYSTALDVKGAAAKGVKKLGVVYCSEAAACAGVGTLLKAAAATVPGMSVVGTQGVSSTAASYAAPCLALKDSGAQAVFLALTQTVESNFVQQCTAQGYNPTWLPGIVSPEWATTPGLDNFVTVTEAFAWFADTPVAQTYRAAMRQYAPQALTEDLSTGPQMWATGLLFAKAATLAGLGDNPTAAQIKSGLSKISAETLGGATGPLTFTGGNRTMRCGFLISAKGGKFVQPSGTAATCV
jgi:branched-chain amino acid transport system substrate-binding protein